MADMNLQKTQISTTEAAKLAKCSTKTIQNRINRGKLSAKRDDAGNWQIDMSEFIRLYPDAQIVRKEENLSEDSTRSLLELEIKHLKQMNEFILAQLETTNAEKAMLIETLSSNQKLLEHHSGEKKRKKFLGIF
jgi:hypothetical protein